MNIGMIGLGQMGWHMAKNLTAAGYAVIGFDPRPDSRQRLAEISATAADSAADVVMSSLSPVFVRALAQRAEGKFFVLDTPASGGVEGAADASLTIMASGPSALQQSMLPILRAMGKNIIDVGDQPGLGATMKTINQAMPFAALASASEMVVAGVKAGLDPDTIIKVVSIRSGGSWALAHRIPLAWQTDNYFPAGRRWPSRPRTCVR